MNTNDTRVLHHNIEVKVRHDDLPSIARRAKELGARKAETLRQVDTYFRAPNGRLKLRETTGQPATLIWYDRPNVASARDSRYRIAKTQDGPALKLALEAALSVRAIVRKRRDLWLYENVRIHLDRVEGLGDFIELEAVVGEMRGATPAVSRRRLGTVIAALKIGELPHLRGSYGEMIGKFRK